MIIVDKLKKKLQCNIENRKIHDYNQTFYSEHLSYNHLQALVYNKDEISCCMPEPRMFQYTSTYQLVVCSKVLRIGIT